MDLRFQVTNFLKNLRDRLGKWYILIDALMMATIISIVVEPSLKVRTQLLIIALIFYLISKILYSWDVAKRMAKNRAYTELNRKF